MNLMKFVIKELGCGSRFQSSLTSYSRHILQVNLG